MMPKARRTVSLSPEFIDFIEDHRGSFSFSSYLEYLCWEGVKRMLEIEVDNKLRKRADMPVRASIRVR